MNPVPRYFVPLLCVLCACAPAWAEKDELISLPKPAVAGKTSVEAAMVAKKSVREYQKQPLTLQQVGQLLWAANGNIPQDAISSATTKTITSAGGIYPLDVFLVVGPNTVGDLPQGAYQYIARTHGLKLHAPGDLRGLLAYASFGQTWMAQAPALIVITGKVDESAARYRDRAFRYVCAEAGSADQNLYLQSESLGLRMATVGAFEDAHVNGVLKLTNKHTPIFIIPVGK
jgi:SagB-type dehydrogenase family enzyme